MSCSKRILVKCLSILSLFLLFGSCSLISDLFSTISEEERKNEESPDSDDSSDQDNTDDSSNPKNPESELIYYKVNGKINCSDIKELPKLISEGKITALDLSDAIILAGGEAYCEIEDNEYINQDNIIGDYMFYECNNLKKVILPTSVSSIGKRAFSRTGLTSVEIPDNIQTLAFDSFAYCSSLENAVLGKNVTSLAQGAFFACAKLKNFYIKSANPPQISAYLFSSNPVIHVYSGALSYYQKSDWKNFGSLKGALEEEYPDDMDSSLLMFSKISTYFDDNACTLLKTSYAELSDKDLSIKMKDDGMEEDLISIVLKIKNENLGWLVYGESNRYLF